MKNQTLAIIAYITVIGWIYTYIQYKNNPVKDALVRYHLGQSLGIFIIAAIITTIYKIVAGIMPSIGSIIALAGLLPLMMLVYGIIAASREAQSPVPGVGKYFENRFGFLN
ncbi:MAG TPA: hypothetical protein VJ720_01395 [Chitinophaga sp.]|uniref:DUF4870 domain-containing protein n=1 Tax=Chitinophaga tropicalis TaxID=2683588 RepID=A0A7K1U9H9_9BACT|nr:DUF4870 domain-containing protein [Chitinophaga tropicalis]MVT11031.1 DUF4870 domain-containing protein [Chitinophaga tropicalis]HJT72628.1 hypothetical protein [Chitinophaga sp.]